MESFHGKQEVWQQRQQQQKLLLLTTRNILFTHTAINNVKTYQPRSAQHCFGIQEGQHL